MPDMMGDAAVESPVLRDAPHQDPLDLRMTVKEPMGMGIKDSGYHRDSSRVAGSSPDSDQIQSPPTHANTFSMEKSFSNRSPPSSKLLSDPGSIEDQTKELIDSFDSPKNGSERVGAPIRPFKMYPHMEPLMYGSMLGSPVGSIGSPSSLASVGLSSLYDSPPSATSPGSSAFGLGVTPMVSYVMQKRRRHEAREKESKEKEQFSSRSPPATATSASLSSADADDTEDSDAKKAKIVPDERKDDAYWERRRKNNEAAKRSRDARRQKEEEIAMRAAFLEQENLKLRAQVAILKNETAKLHYLLYNRV